MKGKITWSLIYPYVKDIEKSVYDELNLMFVRLETGYGSGRINRRSFDWVAEDVIGYGIPENSEPAFSISEIVEYSKKILTLDAGYAIQSVLNGLINEKKITITQRDYEKICSIPEGIIARNKYNHKDPYEALLMKLIEPISESRRWKEIIKPYHAAVVEKVLPKWSHKTFKEKTGINIPSTSYSDWMINGCYKTEELEPYAEQFAQLKRQIENSK